MVSDGFIASDIVTNSAASPQLRPKSLTATPHYHAAKKRKQKVQKITLLPDCTRFPYSREPVIVGWNKVMRLPMSSPRRRSLIAEFLPDLCKFCTSLQSTWVERKASHASSPLEATRFGSNLTEIPYFHCLFLSLTNSRIQFNDYTICAATSLRAAFPSLPPSCLAGEVSIGCSLARLLNYDSAETW